MIEKIKKIIEDIEALPKYLYSFNTARIEAYEEIKALLKERE